MVARNHSLMSTRYHIVLQCDLHNNFSRSTRAGYSHVIAIMTSKLPDSTAMYFYALLFKTT
jgi:hypothetical protein